MRRCGTCKETGHNSRTCPQNKGTKKKTAHRSMRASSWRLRIGDTQRYVMRLQTEHVDGKSEEKLQSIMKDWEIASYIYFPNSSQNSYIWGREFTSEDDWHAFRNEFPYPMEELSSTSNTIKWSSMKKKTKALSKKKVLRAKGKKAKRRQCGFCCGYGHNKRTCKEYVSYLKKQ